MSTTGNNYWSALRVPTGVYTNSGTRANASLNSAFVNGTSGAAIAYRYQARTTAAITEAYFLMDDFAGTLANITLGAAIYNEHASTISQTGSTLRDTATSVSVPSAVDMWIKVTFPGSYSPAVGETLWIVLYNTSASPTIDYPMIQSNTSFGASLNYQTAMNASGYSTTSGFSSVGSSVTRMPNVIVQGSDVFGQPITAASNSIYGSTTTIKGFQIKPTCDIEVSGWSLNVPTSAFSGVKIYDSNTPPAGTALYTFNLGSDANQSRDELIGSKIFAPIILHRGMTYNVVGTFGTASSMTVGYVEDYASYPAVFDALVDRFMVCPAVSNASGAWAVRMDCYPGWQLLVTDLLMSNSRANYALGM